MGAGDATTVVASDWIPVIIVDPAGTAGGGALNMCSPDLLRAASLLGTGAKPLVPETCTGVLAVVMGEVAPGEDAQGD